MTKVEAIIQVSKLESVKNSLARDWGRGNDRARGPRHGRQRGTPSSIGDGNTPSISFQRLSLELVIADTWLRKWLQAISLAARTGKIGDERSFSRAWRKVIRIRNDERGEGAL